MVRLVLVVGILACVCMGAAFAQSCQTLSLNLLSVTGNGQTGFYFSFAPAIAPGAPFFQDGILFEDSNSQSFDLGNIITSDYGVFPAGSYILTLIQYANTPSASGTAVVQLTLGSGLQFSDGSQVMSVTTSTANSAGTTLEINNLAANCANPYTPAPPKMLDPSADLSIGTSLTTDRGMLSSGGREVQGIAADGVAEILLRIPMQNPNDTVSGTIYSDQCTGPLSVYTCLQISYVPDYGGLFPVTASAPLTYPAYSSTSATAGSDGYAYLIYRAPADFVRETLASNDRTVPSRQILVNLVYSAHSGAYSQQTLPVTIIRAPEILVHGYASNAEESWGVQESSNSFFALLGDDHLRTVSWIDYGSKDVTVASTVPTIACHLANPRTGAGPPVCQTTFTQSTFGFTYNTPFVVPQIQRNIRKFGKGANPAKIPVAVAQADFIAHSMGGLILRNWTTIKTGNNAFLANTTFQQGYVHKLVTMGTPNYGSPLATLLLLDNGQVSARCARDNGAAFDRVSIDYGTLAGGAVIGGAVGELAGSGSAVPGSYLNPKLTTLAQAESQLLTVRLAGSVTVEPNIVLSGINVLCPQSDPVASRYTSSSYATLFDYFITPNDPAGAGLAVASDGAVPVSSALTILVDPEPGCPSFLLSGQECHADYAHGASTKELVDGVGRFALDKYLTDGTLAHHVRELLDTSIYVAPWVK